MKHLKQIHILRFICLILFVISIQLSMADENQDSKIQMNNILLSIKKNNEKADAEKLDALATKFTKMITSADFSRTENENSSIKEASEVVQTLMMTAEMWQLDVRDTKQPRLMVIDAFLAKLNSAIDPKWVALPVTTNVNPPEATPNAAAGMNPDSIKDPELRRQFLEQIEKNHKNHLKNSQQRDLRSAREHVLWIVAMYIKTPKGWDRSVSFDRFCKDEESRKILEWHLK